MADAEPRLMGLLRFVGSLIGVSGLLLFLMLRAVYATFYGSLGVAPAEVGLDYGTTLADSAGLILVFAVVALGVPFVATTTVVLVRWLLRLAPGTRVSLAELTSSTWPRLSRALRWTMPIGVLIGLVFLTGWYLQRASTYAEAAQDGHPVEFGLLPLTTFRIRATPITVVPLSDGQPPSLAALATRSDQDPPLLYLGKSDGTLIVYDSADGVVMQIPASGVTAVLANCQLGSDSPDACEDAVS